MLLKAEREGHACISDIGLQAGFSDISHFNWVFRARFGDTPSGVRARGPLRLYKISCFAQ
jgi:AraC-like DNA-binding protein